MIVDYALLANAQKYYIDRGFTFIETPWLVSSETIAITAPPDAKRYVVTKGDKVKEFVASGEQGFLYLALKGYLPFGNYATITPCLRNDNFDFTHLKQFMKCELISLLDGPPDDAYDAAHDMAMIASSFFTENGVPNRINYFMCDNNQFDVETLTGVELGSYGYRHYEGLHWIYGTGLAEPRFSRIRNVVSLNYN